MNELISSIVEAFKKRTSNPLIGTFLVFWLLFHWNFWVTLFFVSENKIYEKTGCLKNEYLFYKSFDFNNWYFYVSSVLPFLLTWLMFWVLPDLILLRAYKKDQSYKKNKKIFKIGIDNEIKKAESRIIKEKAKIIKQNFEIAENEEKIAKKMEEVKRTDPTILWKKEFLEFMENPISKYLDNIIESVYRNSDISNISKNVIAFFDTSGLIELTNDAYGFFAKFTEKGKFFVNEYLKRSN